MVAGHPLDFPFPFSILLCPCLKGPHLPRAEQRPEVCPVNLPFQVQSDPLHSSFSDQRRFRVVIIAIAVGWMFHYWRCATSRDTQYVTLHEI